jgi:glycosyltransferase involved in cell wall biosynthesis
LANQVGLLAYALDRAAGGIGRYTRELLAAFHQIGFEPVILQAGGPPPTEFRTHNLPGSGLLPALLTLGQIQIARAARRHRLDLIHDPTGTAPLALTPARRVVTIHDAIPYVYPHTSTALDRLIYHRWLPLAIQKADAVLTDSQHSRKDILHYLPVTQERLFVIPPAANRHFRPRPPEEVRQTLDRYGVPAPYLLYVGAIEPRKNIPRLLEAYGQLRRWFEKWNLVVVGAPNRWKASPVAETAESLGLSPFIHLTGFVPDEDLPAIYSGADLFVFPSLYEGFGLPVLEAMACGTPVVTSNSSSLPEVAGEAALLVDPTDVDGLVHAMRRVLSDPDLAADLRQRGLERAKGFTWERTARETLAVYKKVLGQD